VGVVFFLSVYVFGQCTYIEAEEENGKEANKRKGTAIK
jgi:hypothetical protein